MQFPHALETVLETLERMREEGAHRPGAARSGIESLKKIPAERAIEGNRPYLATETALPTPSRVSVRDSNDANKSGKLAAINERVSVCVKCPNLASSRTQTVFGVGNPDADVMF